MTDNKYKNDIKTLRQLKDLKNRKNEELKALNAEIEATERMLLERMEIDGIDTISIKGIGTAYVSIKDYPQVKDMDAFVRWCYENNRADMLQKRITATAYASYVQEENIIPDGTDVYQKSTINFRRN